MNKRIQRLRARGWRMPAGVVYVGRPTRWGNPVRITPYRDAAAAVKIYHRLVLGALAVDHWALADIKESLGGRDLACWCRLDQPCHADLLLWLANDAEDEMAAFHHLKHVICHE